MIQLSKGELNGHPAPKEIVDALNQGFKEKRVVQGDQVQLKWILPVADQLVIHFGTNDVPSLSCAFGTDKFLIELIELIPNSGTF